LCRYGAIVLLVTLAQAGLPVLLNGNGELNF
jgi:hypothetical protein